MTVDVATLLRKTTFRSVDVEHLLDPNRPSWVKFDPEVGYVPDDIVMKDGIDFSYSTYSHEPGGQRRMVNYRDLPCRINTYGDSFTQCQQVSDDETWQERLAAHFGEPIRNFGSGGWGVWQCYRRMRRIEETELGAEHILLSIFDDDHIRNLDAARWIRTFWNEQDRTGDEAYPLHGLPWSHLRYDLEKGGFVELPGACACEDDLRALCDPDHFYATFKDDQIVRLYTIELGGEAPCEDLEALAEVFGLEVNLRDPDTRAKDAFRLHLIYGFKSTEYLIEQMLPWAEGLGKKVLITLCYGQGTLGNYLANGDRYDPEFVAYLESKGLPYLDVMKKHAADYAAFKLDVPEYIDRYYINAAGAAVFGHYNPTGNHFFAFSIKNDLVRWLEPSPPAYKA